MLVALKRPDFPHEHLGTAVPRISGGGTPARIELARQIHEAPADRRDAVHLQLLMSARKVKSTAELIDAVIGQDDDRARWLEDCADRKILSLLAGRDERRRA